MCLNVNGDNVEKQRILETNEHFGVLFSLIRGYEEREKKNGGNDF